MRGITSIRFLIPALTLGILLSAAGLVFVGSYYDAHEKIQNDLKQKVEKRLYMIQSIAESLTARGLQGQLQHIVSSFAAEKDMHTLVVADASGRVIAANRVTSINRNWQAAYLHLDPAMIGTARQTRTIQLDLHLHDDTGSPGNEHVAGYNSFCPPVSETRLRPTNCGFIAYVVNTAPHYASADTLLIQLAIKLVIGLLLVSAAILISLNTLVVRPTRRLTDSLQQFAVGDRTVRIPDLRNDEMGHLGHTLNAFLDWITEDEQALKDQQQRLSTVFDTVVDAIITIDSFGIIQSVNPATEQMFGYEAGELTGQNVSILMPRDVAAEHDGYLQHYRETGEQHIIGVGREVMARTKQHRLFTAELSVSEMQLKGERFFTGVIRDISERAELMQEMEYVNEQLVDKEERLRAVFDAVTDAIITIDSNGLIQNSNQATERLFGYTREALLGQDITMLMPAHLAEAHRQGMQRYLETGEKQLIGQGAAEVQAVHRNGSIIPVAVSLAEMNIKGERFFTGLIRDITEQVNLREIMEQLNKHLLDANLSLQESATTDGLTGLANRRHFDDILGKELARTSRDKHPLSLLLLDVDYFKRYNDHYGHQQGDDCLRDIATAMRNVFQRENDLPARYGGEEFAVILPNTDQAGAELMAGRLHAAIRELDIPHAESGVADIVSVSIGITTYRPDGHSTTSPLHLINTADKGLYAAKAEGRNRSCFEAMEAGKNQASAV